MGRNHRDNQRSRCYLWEGQAVQALLGRSIHDAEFATLAECEAFAAPIWRKERGRVGLARQIAPSIERPSWGQRSALAHSTHRITLPRWARSRWVILHEMAHRLTPKDEAHGPRFVGVLIGLACRWLDMEADALMRLADDCGVRYFVRSIGVVPVHGPAWHVERAMRKHGPQTAMDLACLLSIVEHVPMTAPQVRGAALVLIRAGKCRWLRNRLTPTAAPVAEVPAARPARKPANGVRALAKRHGIDIEREGGGWVVWPPSWLCDSEADAYNGDHFASTWAEVRERVVDYSQMTEARATDAAD